MALTLDRVDVHSQDKLATRGYPWEDWDLLRRDAPVYWYERDDVEPFWAITKHADIQEISGRSDIFINGGPRLRLTLKGEPEILRGGLDEFGKARGWDPDEPHDFVFMDDPRHRNFRSIASRSFTPGRLKKSADHFQRLANQFAGELEEALADGPGDFVDDFSVKLPLAAICEMFALPADDWRQIFTWTNALVGDVDRFARADETPMEASARGFSEFRSYLEKLVIERRSRGADGDNLLDRVISGMVEGVPLTDQQLIGYLLLLIAAGNETTRNGTTGGMIALLNHPEQCKRLCDDPSLLDSAVEEMLRWTSPVYAFLRTATADYELRGTRIAAGDTVGMFYPSANRDEEVFDNPYAFDVGRTPNPHLAFGGYGAHFCLGANLARAEMRASFRALLPLLSRLELAGEPVRNPHLHVPGYKSLPVALGG